MGTNGHLKVSDLDRITEYSDAALKKIIGK